MYSIIGTKVNVVEYDNIIMIVKLAHDNHNVFLITLMTIIWFWCLRHTK